uniref:DUF7788 domain-containing protein n=1 Tax=Oryza glumipatula TaxID=40148 RepID=A0A0E0A242_9ORYZ
MVRKVFVLSDMELDAGAWRSQDELNTIRCKFAAKGLSAPEVVFWNVGAPASTPVVEPQENAGGENHVWSMAILSPLASELSSFVHSTSKSTQLQV